MLTEFLKANVRDFVDIEASEGADGETTESNDDGMSPSPNFFLMLISDQQERMASSTTTAVRRTWNRQKKTTIIVRACKHMFSYMIKLIAPQWIAPFPARFPTEIVALC
jgi:hypothetical protein